MMVFLSHWHVWSHFTPTGPVQQFVREVFAQLYHFTTVITWPTGGQHPAVVGFFVLSGFCIHYPIEHRARSGGARVSWRDYFHRRFLRIAPVYWAASILGLLFVMAEVYRPSEDPLLSLHASTTWLDAVVRLVGVAGIYPHEVLAGNGILTTVSVEMVMYAVYPAFHWFALRGDWRVLGLIFVTLQLLGLALLPYLNPFWVFNSIIMLGLFWYAGALAAHLFLGGRWRRAGGWLLVTWIGFLGLKSLPHFTGLNLLKQAVWGVVCMLGILWVLRLEQQRPMWGRHRGTVAFRRVGGLSYSLYAMHTPAMMLGTWALLHVGVRDYFIQLLVTLIAGLGVTAAVYYGIERVFYRPRVEGRFIVSGKSGDVAVQAGVR